MKLCRFKTDDSERLGCVVGEGDDKILDVSDAAGDAAFVVDGSAVRRIEDLLSESGNESGKLD